MGIGYKIFLLYLLLKNITMEKLAKNTKKELFPRF